jgi:rhodanese-related sulfurtransferase
MIDHSLVRAQASSAAWTIGQDHGHLGRNRKKGIQMPKTANEMVAEANANVPRINQKDAAAMLEKGAVLLDVREPPEVAQSGKAEGAVTIPRGLLEFRADPSSGMHDPALDPEKPVILYCAAGGRAALAGNMLKELGYKEVYNLGGFKDWAEAGGSVE